LQWRFFRQQNIISRAGVVMPDRVALNELIGFIYDCAIEPKHWAEALQHIAGYVGGSAASLSLQDPLRRQVKLVSQWGFPPEIERRLLEAAPINPLLSTGWYVELERPFTGEAVLGRKNYIRTRFYNEVVAPSGLYDAALAVLARSAERFGAVTIASQSPIKRVTLDRVGQLAPHLRRAVGIADLLESRSLQNDALSSAMNLLTLAVVLVDEQGRITYANDAASELISEGRSVRRDGDTLSCKDLKAARELRRAIQLAADGRTAEIPPTGIPVPIGASDGGDLAAWILPLDRGLRGDLATSYSAKVAVFLRRLHDTSPLPGEVFVKHYAISPAECRVLMMLAQGMTVKEASVALGISESTAKTHLKKLFEKTGTSRQAELLMLTMGAIAPASGAVSKAQVQ
jgi:DNA-binding CsgD family transcriptional regulator/PAS domain-containing protein